MSERDPHAEPARLKDLIGEVGARLGVRRAAAVGALWSRWPEIVGDDVAANAEPTSVREGVLRIRTASSSWATEIGYLGDEIARRVNDAMGGDLVREVRVWTGPEPIRVRPPEGRSEQRARLPATSPGEPSGRRDRRSPSEALEAARNAWRRRVAGGGSARRGRPQEAAHEAPRAPEKGS